MKKPNLWIIMSLLAISILLASCAGPEPEVVERIVTQEVEVVVTEEVEVLITPVPEPEIVSDPTAPITVWIDGIREPALDLYKELHPDVADLINVEIVDRVEFPSKVLLFNNVGEGWPDVVFAEAWLVARVSDQSRNWTLDLTPYVDPEILADFVGADHCTVGGRLLCLKNDLAMNVLYYNKPLMDEFGYEVPTTWEEYEALGERVAAEHPGYVIGAFGDLQGVNTYFWPSRCPVTVVNSSAEVYIDTSHPNCVRAAEMVDNLVANGSVTTFGPFDPLFIELAQENKLLMFIGASWYAELVFGGTEDSLYYKTAEGQLGVAPPLRWEAEDTNWTGAQGGATWAVSRHTKNVDLAVDLITWLTTAPEHQVELAQTYPSYGPAALEWADRIRDNPLYANDPVPVFVEAAAVVDPRFGNVRYDYETPFTNSLIAAAQAGELTVDALPAWQDLLVQEATLEGYQVATEE